MIGQRIPKTWIFTAFRSRLICVYLIVLALFSSPVSTLAQTANDCLLKPSADVQLAVKASGVVQTVAVRRGDPVTEGQVLLTLSDEMERVAVTIAEARALDRSNLDGIIARLAVADAQLERMKNLADGSLITRERLDQAEQDALTLKQEKRVAEAALRIAALEADRARAALSRLSLRTPLSGVVTERHLDPGEFASEQSPAITIVTLDPLLAEAWIDAEAWGRLSKGDVAEISTTRALDQRYSARIQAIDPILETVSSTFRVTLSVPNPDRALPAGLPCTLYLD